MILQKDYDLIISKLAHELRNPLTTISSTLQLIELKHPEAKDFSRWSSLFYDIDFMIQLINDFSNLSSSRRLNLSTFELKPLIQQTVDSFASYAPDVELKYTDCIESPFYQITGDKIKLQEVISNLLKNAFEATSSGGMVHLHTVSDYESVFIIIKDTGCGIPEEHLSSIFNPFVTYKKNGTGLGLSIVKDIVDAHGGSIELESIPCTGTTFRIKLPAKQPGDDDSRK